MQKVPFNKEVDSARSEVERTFDLPSNGSCVQKVPFNKEVERTFNLLKQPAGGCHRIGIFCCPW